MYMCFIRQLLPLILIATSDINKHKICFVAFRYGDQSSEVVHDVSKIINKIYILSNLILLFQAIYGIGHTTLAGIQIYELGPRSFFFIYFSNINYFAH